MSQYLRKEDEELWDKYQDGTLTLQDVLCFCRFGVHTGNKRFQRHVYLEENGFKIAKMSSGWKLYID